MGKGSGDAAGQAVKAGSSSRLTGRRTAWGNQSCTRLVASGDDGGKDGEIQQARGHCKGW